MSALRLSGALPRAAAALLLASSAEAVEIHKDYAPSRELWNFTFVQVELGEIDNYLAVLRDTWLSTCEAQKQLGIALECRVLLSDTPANRDFNMILMVRFTNAGVTDPDPKLYEKLMTAYRKRVDEQRERKAIEGYQEMRSFFGEQNFRDIEFK